MIKKSFAFVLCFLIVLFCISCGNGKAKANKMTLEFNSNPTTGFDWFYEIGDGDGNVELESNEYKSSAKEGMVGAGGVRTFIFKGIKEGKQTITFTYKRNWEGGEKAYDVIYEIDVDNNLNITCLNKLKGVIEANTDLDFFPNPIFSE